jgi:beta-barrel assembly-enhancing protease
MKRSITIALIIILFPLFSFGQSGISIPLKLEGEVTRIINNLPVGTIVTLVGIVTPPFGGPAYASIVHKAGMEQINLEQLDRIDFNAVNLDDFWIIKALENDVYASMVKYGFQYDLRTEMETDMDDYITYLENNDLILHDSYLENYMHSLALRIFPGRLTDGRSGGFSVKIIKDTNPNASVYSNGTMLISSGLLSLVESEEELIAVLAHEIAHFVLDHSVINRNAAIRRQKRAEFWADVLIGVAAVADNYESQRNPYHIRGELTWSVAVISTAIADMVTEHMGMKFSREQEIVADKVAAEVISFVGMNPDAFSSVLIKLKELHSSTGNVQALQGGSHPNVQERISRLGLKPGEYKSTLYDARFSVVNSFNAKQFLLTKNYESAKLLAYRNIDAGVAVEDDYLVLAAINMALYDDDQRNREALQYITTAKSLNIYPPLLMFKQEALVLFRLGRNSDAEESLKIYSEGLLEQQRFGGYSQFLANEIEWTTKMIARARLL